MNPTNRCDFWSNTIKYENTVVCPDWNSDNNIECGNGLHLSPSPSLALGYNEGLVLECEVDLDDMVVYKYDISKVRCRKVKVLGEYKKLS